MATEHEFDDIEYVRRWSETANERRPQRPAMFRDIAAIVRNVGKQSPCVLELGCGPGALAEVLLTEIPSCVYEGVDFSGAMLQLARERLAAFRGRCRLTQADLTDPAWLEAIGRPVDAVVTNQALHDLGSDAAVAMAYRQVHDLLPQGGVLVNADLVVPGTPAKPDKPGKITVAEHVKLLREAGFRDPQCSVDHGEYACLVARK